MEKHLCHKAPSERLLCFPEPNAHIHCLQIFPTKEGKDKDTHTRIYAASQMSNRRTCKSRILNVWVKHDQLYIENGLQGCLKQGMNCYLSSCNWDLEKYYHCTKRFHLTILANIDSSIFRKFLKAT